MIRRGGVRESGAASQGVVSRRTPSFIGNATFSTYSQTLNESAVLNLKRSAQHAKILFSLVGHAW